MRSGLRIRLSYANVVAALALLLTLGGVSYAAISLPGKSVGTKQLARNAVTGSKVKNGTLTAADAKGKLPAGPTGKTGKQGPIGENGTEGSPSNAKLTVMSGSVTLGTANEVFAPSGLSVAGADEPLVTMLSPARPMIARNLSVRLAIPPGAPAGSRRFDVRINNTLTTVLECVVTHPATTCTSAGSAKDELLIPANTRISIGNVSSNVLNATRAQFAFTLERTP